jgi:hypothetical protein
MGFGKGAPVEFGFALRSRSGAGNGGSECR